jgi:hypothetical protein
MRRKYKLTPASLPVIRRIRRTEIKPAKLRGITPFTLAGITPFTLLIALLILEGCSTPAGILETRPLHEGDTLSRQGYVYSLPMTSFRLSLEVARTRTIRGPYYRFADKLLNIKDVPEKNREEYRISKVRLESFQESDPGQVYLVRQVSGQTDLSNLLKLGEEGLVFDMQKAVHSGDQVLLPEVAPQGPLFTELSMEKNTAMSIDTFYKTILTDTSFIRVPVLKEQLMVKTIDEKAEEAADFILELRYERFMMLTGNNATLVSDGAVKRLDEIERQYLELFTGKTFEERMQYTYFITPSGDEVFENIEVLEFSDKRGVIDQGGPDSEALSLRIRKAGKTRLLRDPLRPEKLPVQTNALYYRVPDVAFVEVSLGGRTLFNDRFQVSQYGEILVLPMGPAQQKGLRNAR